MYIGSTRFFFKNNIINSGENHGSKTRSQANTGTEGLKLGRNADVLMYSLRSKIAAAGTTP